MDDFGGILLILIAIALALFFIVSMWKVFVKAGQPGWGVLIPIYNIYLLLMIAGKPGWWLILYLIPFVNLVIGILVSIDIAKNFGNTRCWIRFRACIFWNYFLSNISLWKRPIPRNKPKLRIIAFSTKH